MVPSMGNCWYYNVGNDSISGHRSSNSFMQGLLSLDGTTGQGRDMLLSRTNLRLHGRMHYVVRHQYNFDNR